MPEIWETKEREKLIKNLIFAGVSKRFGDGQLFQESVQIKIMGGPEVSFPSEYWPKIKATIDELLKQP